MNKLSLVVLAGAVFMSGCVSSGKRFPKARYSHSSYGVVTTKHPALRNAGRVCNSAVYGKGVRIGGTVTRSREEAAVIWLARLVRISKQSKGNSRAALNRMKRSRVHRNFRAAENRYKGCLQRRGFRRVGAR